MDGDITQFEIQSYQRNGSRERNEQFIQCFPMYMNYRSFSKFQYRRLRSFGFQFDFSRANVTMGGRGWGL